MIRVLIDGWQLDASGHRGVGRYAHNLVEGLGHVEGLELEVLRPEGSGVPRCEHRFSGRLRQVEHARHVGRFAQDADIVHAPGFPYPSRSPVPIVVTIHDLFPLELRGRRYLNGRINWTLGRSAAKRSARVVAVSQFTADQVMRHLGIAADRIDVVHPGLDPSFGPAADHGAAPDIGRDGDPYVLLVAGGDPRKGHGAALAAIDAVADAGLPHRLVIAGRIPPALEPDIRRRLAACSHPERVELAGYVEDLPGLYRSAAATLVTSLGEGFGYPALESMASGTPVVAFDNTATSEVVGGAGVLVADQDRRALAAELIGLLRDPAGSLELVGRGLLRAGDFERVAAAAGVAESYRRALQSR